MIGLREGVYLLLNLTLIIRKKESESNFRIASPVRRVLFSKKELSLNLLLVPESNIF